MVGEGRDMLVLEMADYVFTGSDSKPLAVVELSEGIKEGERERCGLAS